MKSSICLALSTVIALSFPATGAFAGVVAEPEGWTLYTFDEDVGGVPTCYGDCAAKWSPYLSSAGVQTGEEWTLVDRSDGTKQWAYEGKPVYCYVGDKKRGDVTGDGLGGVWHAVYE